jgi:hypothetical protein
VDLLVGCMVSKVIALHREECFIVCVYLEDVI